MDIDKFCVLPFRGLQIWTDGTLKPCCIYQQNNDSEPLYHISQFQQWWNVGLQPLRQKFIDQTPAAGCRLCFQPEYSNSGVRVNVNKWMIDNVPDISVSQTPEHLDITFGNVCNLKCLMCSSLSSSRVETEYLQNKQKFNLIGIAQPSMPRLQKWWENPEILNQVLQIVKNAKYINFSGGEPLITKQLVDILRAIPKTCQVEINTNLTSLTEEHIECIKKFDLSRISISLDGIGKHHEYIRYESNWSTIEQNINKLLNADLPKTEIAFSYVLQHTSLFTFPNFWNYFKNYKNFIRVSEVVPESIKNNMLTIHSAVDSDVAKFKQWHKNNSTPYDTIISQWVNTYKFNQQAHRDFVDYVDLLDQIRGCNFRTTFNPSW